MKRGQVFLAAAIFLTACRATSPLEKIERVNERRQSLLERLGGTDAVGELFKTDKHGGPLLAGEALEAYAAGSEAKAVLLARSALAADPENAARRRLLKALDGTSSPEAEKSVQRANKRRQRILEDLGGNAAFSEVLRADEHGGPLLAGEALEAYAAGSEPESVQLARSALAADPESKSRRRFLEVFEKAAGIAPEPPSAEERPAPQDLGPALHPAPLADQRRDEILARLGGSKAIDQLLGADEHGGPLLAGEALEAYAQGLESKAVQLARSALAADPQNATRRRFLKMLEANPLNTAEPAREETAAPPPDLSHTERFNKRRQQVIEQLGGLESFTELLRPDEFDGPALAAEALEAFAEGSELKAVLLAQSSLGADPGNGTRRRLLVVIEKTTGILADPDGLLPLAALVQHELAMAETAFFDGRFGASLQACRRALLLSPEDRSAWTRLGSSFYALGDVPRARDAWSRAGGLTPSDAFLTRFLTEKGWAK